MKFVLWDIRLVAWWESANVQKEHVTSIFGTKEYETRMKQTTSRATFFVLLLYRFVSW
jgi:hypothetical protein